MSSKLQALIQRYSADYGDEFLSNYPTFEEVLKVFAHDVLELVAEDIEETCAQCKYGRMQKVARRGDRQFYTCDSCGTSWSRKEVDNVQVQEVQPSVSNEGEASTSSSTNP